MVDIKLMQLETISNNCKSERLTYGDMELFMKTTINLFKSLDNRIITLEKENEINLDNIKVGGTDD